MHRILDFFRFPTISSHLNSDILVSTLLNKQYPNLSALNFLVNLITAGKSPCY
jgi:hypothetical protein